MITNAVREFVDNNRFADCFCGCSWCFCCLGVNVKKKTVLSANCTIIAKVYDQIICLKCKKYASSGHFCFRLYAVEYP